MSQGDKSVKGQQTDFTQYGLDIRGSVQPRQWWNNTGRRFDAGIGYFSTFRFASKLPQNIQHGPYLELIAYPWIYKGENWTRKLGISVSPELVFASRDIGVGVNFGVSWEWVTFSKGENVWTAPNGFAAAKFRGEGGIGFQLTSGIRRVDDEDSWLLLGAIVFRWPATIGIAGGWR